MQASVVREIAARLGGLCQKGNRRRAAHIPMVSTALPTEMDRVRTRYYSFVATETGKHLRPWAVKLKRTWFAMQISHRGKYSIERMIALNEYTRTASILRVLFVCVTTPMPMIVLVLLVEMIPLQDPSDGWQANYGIWIRTALQAGVVALAAADQARHLLHGVRFSVFQLLALFVSIAVNYTGAAIAVAASLGFPIPFMAITMSTAFFTVLIASFRIVAGKRVFREILAQRNQLYIHWVPRSTDAAVARVSILPSSLPSSIRQR